MIRAVLERCLTEIGISITEEDMMSLELFVDELKKWNRKVNLTAICSDEDIAVKHIIDSLLFAAWVNDGERVLDVGSGAGIPAIPLNIVKPGVQVVSVDAVGKKILFQRHAARVLSLKDFEALHTRVEQLGPAYAASFDVIVSRAFSNLETFVALAAPLLKRGGRIIAMKGPHVCSECDRAGDALQRSGFHVDSVHTYSLPMNKGERSLVILGAVNARG